MEDPHFRTKFRDKNMTYPNGTTRIHTLRHTFKTNENMGAHTNNSHRTMFYNNKKKNTYTVP